VRQIFAAELTHLQADLPDLAPSAATATSPLARFLPTAATVSDQTVDQWVEQELQRGRRRVRAGLAMLAVLAVAAIQLVLFVK
jgi:hypothetical protein